MFIMVNRCLAYIVEVAIGLFVKVRLFFLTANCSRGELCLFVVNPIAFSSLSVLIVIGLPLAATMLFKTRTTSSPFKLSRV